tara:strand:- start:112106 stop:112426 length:321 start_codon:yes stop_codon:yes gene_type:complete
MFNKCEFIIGKDKSLVIMVPEAVPKGEAMTITVSDDKISFYRAGAELIGEVFCVCEKTRRCLRKKSRVGLIEAINGRPSFPVYIATTARVVDLVEHDMLSLISKAA